MTEGSRWELDHDFMDTSSEAVEQGREHDIQSTLEGVHDHAETERREVSGFREESKARRGLRARTHPSLSTASIEGTPAMPCPASRSARSDSRPNVARMRPDSLTL